MSQKLLIVDDEPGIVAVVQNYFEMAGYLVITAYNGKDALKKLSQAPDIVLLDINMPDMDGLTVCQNIRKYITCPIIFLTARIETSDKIKGFSVGADDYIVKPFAFEELLARIRSIFRRTGKFLEQDIRSIGDLSYDAALRELKGPSGQIRLSGRESRLLEVFLSETNTTLRRMTILSRVWGADAPVEESNLDTYIHFLRKRLAFVGSSVNLETVRGVGYRMEVPK